MERLGLKIDDLFNVHGLVAVITGGGTGSSLHPKDKTLSQRLILSRFSPGIGKMMATALAENGAHKIYVIGRRDEPLQEVAAKFPG